MNTNALKRFAQQARIKLLDLVGTKLEYVLNTDTPELREKSDQVRKLREVLAKSSKEQVIDKVTYTWFNRFMALRFMDANDYQPIGIRVLTPKDGYTLPELLDEAKQGIISTDLAVKNQRIFDLLDGKIPSRNAQNEAYKELLIGACNNLHQVLPFLFERINDYTELLLPDDLTSELSIIQDMRNGMSIEDCAEVEIIGWLYQFYISDKKDEVFASKAAVKKEDIPAATQLFTPRWIVEYMVQNTVGKLWLQNKPSSRLRDHMPYFIESPSVTAEDYLKVNSVVEIKLLDQACGSGHIMVYGFDLLYKIYEEEGYNPNEIPELIIKNNLYGFEIDERAAQLAGMALMFKARSYNRRFFKKEVKPTILCYKDLVLNKEEIKEAFESMGYKLSEEINHDLTQMQQATNFGSLIVPHTSTQELEKVLATIIAKENKGDAFLQYQLEQLKTTIEQLLLLSNKYHCVVDNPPYMNSSKMNKLLLEFVTNLYPKSKADLMTCFMERAQNQLYEKGFTGMINLPSWMFLASFVEYRNDLICNFQIDTLLHLGRGVFGSDFGSVTFTFQNKKPLNAGIYRRLFKEHVKVRNIEKIRELFLDFDYGFHKVNQVNFLKIPNNPLGYWLPEKIYELFEVEPKISDKNEVITGMTTGNNNEFIKIWAEVSYNKLFLDKETMVDYEDEKSRWIPYTKGGNYRRWYGNYEYVVDWSKHHKFNRAKNSLQRLYLKPGITWSFITAGKFNARILNKGFLWDVGGSPLFIEEESHKLFILGYFGTKVAQYFMNIMNPTVNFQAIDVGNNLFLVEKVLNLDNFVIPVTSAISISECEWESKETAWGFTQNELIRINGQDIEETYDLYLHYWSNKFFDLHRTEERLNRQFIEIYGLQEELTPDVPLEDITILKEETSVENGQLVFHADEVFAQFISYAVGCMFGRYSLDAAGLILANQGETLGDYLNKVTKTKEDLVFKPDEDNIIPILDDEWFEDDIVGRFYAFLKASFGSANFDKNLAFVEESLGKDIRKYFVKDFYTDHIKRYKKRPIYWMFSSPKGSFNVLIYMHRYTPDTLNKILNSYLVAYREKLNIRMDNLDHLIVSGSSADQTKSQKEKDRIRLVVLELLDYERDVIRPLAIERINIVLDEGVLVNYNKFGAAIKEVAGLNDKATKKKVREFDWIDVSTII